MKELRKTLKYANMYSSFLHENIPKILMNEKDHKYHIARFLINNPIPSQLKKYRIKTYSQQKVIHMPLHENPDLKFRTKLIVWDPLTMIEEHSHEGENCFFQPFHGGMTQTVYQDELPITNGVRHTEFSFINDSIGTHSMYNTLHSKSNTTFHLYYDTERA